MVEIPYDKDQRRKEIIDTIIETVVNIVVIFAIVFSVRYTFISPFRVSGSSMVDTLHDRDFILVERIHYWFANPTFGDVVIVEPPKDDTEYYVKRVIGTPGDTLEFKDGEVYISNNAHPEGYQIPESFLVDTNKGNTYLPSTKNKKVVLGADEYFVMGDNRRFSSDSRTWYEMSPDSDGSIPKKRIVGKVWVRVFPSPKLIDDLK